MLTKVLNILKMQSKANLNQSEIKETMALERIKGKYLR